MSCAACRERKRLIADMKAELEQLERIVEECEQVSGPAASGYGYRFDGTYGPIGDL